MKESLNDKQSYLFCAYIKSTKLIYIVHIGHCYQIIKVLKCSSTFPVSVWILIESVACLPIILKLFVKLSLYDEGYKICYLWKCEYAIANVIPGKLPNFKKC